MERQTADRCASSLNRPKEILTSCLLSSCWSLAAPSQPLKNSRKCRQLLWFSLHLFCFPFLVWGCFLSSCYLSFIELPLALSIACAGCMQSLTWFIQYWSLCAYFTLLFFFQTQMRCLYGAHMLLITSHTYFFSWCAARIFLCMNHFLPTFFSPEDDPFSKPYAAKFKKFTGGWQEKCKSYKAIVVCAPAIHLRKSDLVWQRYIIGEERLRERQKQEPVIGKKIPECKIG